MQPQILSKNRSFFKKIMFADTFKRRQKNCRCLLSNQFCGANVLVNFFSNWVDGMNMNKIPAPLLLNYFPSQCLR